jgi:hypothetical protein
VHQATAGCHSNPHWLNRGSISVSRRFNDGRAYIKKLEIPVKRLFRDSEELLYLSRRAELLALMAGKTSDIDIDGFIQQVNEASQAHRSAMDQLNIDEVVVSPLSLESHLERYRQATVDNTGDGREKPDHHKSRQCENLERYL